MSKSNHKPEAVPDETADILKIAGRMDSELAQLPMPSHGAIINVLSQLCEHRIAMIQREEQKKRDQQAREAQFAVSPHLKV